MVYRHRHGRSPAAAVCWPAPSHLHLPCRRDQHLAGDHLHLPSGPRSTRSRRQRPGQQPCAAAGTVACCGNVPGVAFLHRPLHCMMVSPACTAAQQHEDDIGALCLSGMRCSRSAIYGCRATQPLAPGAYPEGPPPGPRSHICDGDAADRHLRNASSLALVQGPPLPLCNGNVAERHL